jgi:predicted nicotinamide N-methyase
MSGKRKKDVLCYGIHALSSGHHDIRILKKEHAPHWFGYRVWASSWLLMDFLRNCSMPTGSHVMELGCGWGLAGIYCAKNFGAEVTGVDIDPEVFHYLHRHSEINDVEIATINLGIEDLTREHLKGVKVLIGADICFWDSMVDPIRSLISRALEEGVRQVILADPGRGPFRRLGEFFGKEIGGEMLRWSTLQPHPIEGRILRITSHCTPRQ